MAERHIHAPDGFGHLVIQAIQQLLTETNTKLEEIDCFAAASGPGSFTGVRVGLTAVKGLAEAMHKPAIGISNLRAMSLAGHADLRAAVLDARRDQVYGAVYNAQAELVGEEVVTSREEWLKLVPADAEWIGAVNGPYGQYLAAAVAECAERDGVEKWLDPVGIDANYVRRSDAELFWKDA